MLACLMDRNKSWPALAPVLILTFVEPIWTEQDRDNATAVHDVRVASAMMPIQAEALDLRTHHMAGIHHDVIRAAYVVSEEFNAVSAIAMGHQGTLDLLTEDKNRARESNPWTRKSLDEIVLAGTFGTPAKLAL
jgi:hypothetical protein